jgi:hypothetical protein
VFGYAVLNDLSARDWVPAPTFLGLDWVMLKGFDASAPMGPLDHTGAVRGRSGRPGDQAVGQRRAAAGLTHVGHGLRRRRADRPPVVGHDARAGDVIATGTPAGVGFGRTPPSYLEVGDVVRAEIEGLGVLETPIAAALRTPEHATKGGIGT